MTQPLPFPTLETERLLLREIRDSDASALFAIYGDTALMRWFGMDPLVDLAAAQNLVKVFASWRLLPNPGTRWAIQIKGETALVGTCGLFSWNRESRKCVVGYDLAAPVHGRGYMREALSAVISWGFMNMELNRIEAQIHPENTQSLKLARAIGFAEEGRLRETGYWGGQYHDLLQFSLLQREWTFRHAET
ncbi:ribosomal-protein-alanine N-acetyltransferase [Andreprevotia lacus DSM 23236]|jgi:ribosomal-protein-alanine N-acetyltransferase|uniref:Ribosomal-protein-alanine N-acetyltransferase n=1 Tax=Andreprevotia lacus DSM 23236 TaxID=1121001 RepID=A0A1W1XZF7_9NEIS|nr:GNAT family protein [Andreprevotia lacus]SMC29359.1 ribosomal-protein-alanine N-acetyltransferase [Andreprevotia lacus DSM 23236]